MQEMQPLQLSEPSLALCRARTLVEARQNSLSPPTVFDAFLAITRTGS